MNPEQQRVAIAKVCGWFAREDKDGFWRAVDASGNMTHELWMSERNVWSAGIPNYLNDLNAMHEVESILNADQMVSYDYHLDLMVGNGRQGLNIEYFLWSATASQRAEAFLRTIGTWEESK